MPAEVRRGHPIPEPGVWMVVSPNVYSGNWSPRDAVGALNYTESSLWLTSLLWCFIVYAFKFNVPLVPLKFIVPACDKFPSG